MYADNQDRIEQDMTPFGFIIDGNDDEIGESVDEYGTRWSPVTIRDKDTDW